MCNKTLENRTAEQATPGNMNKKPNNFEIKEIHCEHENLLPNISAILFTILIFVNFIAHWKPYTNEYSTHWRYKCTVFSSINNRIKLEKWTGIKIWKYFKIHKKKKWKTQCYILRTVQANSEQKQQRWRCERYEDYEVFSNFICR